MSEGSALPFEFIGDAKWLGDESLAEFVEASKAHPWIGGPPGRVVISTDLVHDMQRFMPEDMLASWLERQRSRHEGSGAIGVGMSFVARDGIQTAVIADLGTKDGTLALFGHEYIEAATDARLAASGFRIDPVDAEARHARALWGEYVVERTRREISDQLGWPVTSFDNSELVAAAEDAAKVSGQHEGWLYSVLALTYAKALAHADAGVTAERESIGEFFEMPIGTDAWRALGECFRDAYAHPHGDPSVFDARTFQAWGRVWKTRP